MIFNSKTGWKWLSATLLPVLGFAGCGNPGDSPDLYGTPTSDYQFKGRVTDADGKPVEDIKVVSGIVEGDRGFHEDSVATDADGHFVTNSNRKSVCIALFLNKLYLHYDVSPLNKVFTTLHRSTQFCVLGSISACKGRYLFGIINISKKFF